MPIDYLGLLMQTPVDQYVRKRDDEYTVNWSSIKYRTLETYHWDLLTFIVSSLIHCSLL